MPRCGDRQTPGEGEVQAEEGQPEQQHVDGAEPYSKRCEEPDDRCDQGKHAIVIPTRNATRNEGRMAGRTPVAVTSVNRTALTVFPTPATSPDVANGNVCYNDGATVLVLLNTDSSTHTLTVQMASGSDGQTTGPRSYTVTISANQQWTGVFPVQFYSNQLAFNLDSTLVKVQPVSLLSP